MPFSLYARLAQLCLWEMFSMSKKNLKKMPPRLPFPVPSD